MKWKYVTTNNGKSKTHYDTVPEEEFTVAASSGLKAIERAKLVALDVEERGYEDDWSDPEEVIKATPVQVTDVVGLTLKDCLDG